MTVNSFLKSLKSVVRIMVDAIRGRGGYRFFQNRQVRVPADVRISLVFQPKTR